MLSSDSVEIGNPRLLSLRINKLTTYPMVNNYIFKLALYNSAS
jgi:hypothetical protein